MSATVTPEFQARLNRELARMGLPIPPATPVEPSGPESRVGHPGAGGGESETPKPTLGLPSENNPLPGTECVFRSIVITDSGGR